MSNVLSRLLLKAGGVAVRPLQLLVGSGLQLVDNKNGTATLSASGGGGGGGSSTTLDMTVSNNTGSTIAAGTAVNLRPNASANYPRVQPTNGDGSDTPGAGFPLGITTSSIANGGTVPVRVTGIVTNLDTHLFLAGDDIQGDASGALAAWNNNPWLGRVLVSDATVGQVWVGGGLIDFNTPIHAHHSTDGGGYLQFPVFNEITTPANAPAGTQIVYIDSVDHKLKRVNSTGTVTIIG